MAQGYEVGQAWSYEAPNGFEHSRIIIGAILTFAHHEPVICCAVTGAPMVDKNGQMHALTIPFLPFSKTAFDQTVLVHEGEAELPEPFARNYQSWKTDQKGLGFINIPFRGLLRNMADGLAKKAGQVACIEDQ